MTAWIPAAIGGLAGIGAGLIGGGSREQETRPDQFTRNLRASMFSTAPRVQGDAFNFWQIPDEAFGYGPGRIYGRPLPMTKEAMLDVHRRGTQGSPLERAAQGYAQRAIGGANLFSNPAMGPLGFYGMGGATPNYMGGPGRGLMLGTAAGSGYQNPYLDAAVRRAQEQTAGTVARMFGRSGMGGSSMETQLATRELGDIASRMYGQAYDAERGRQVGMQSALGGLETNRLGQMLTGRGQNIGALQDLGRLFGQERSLQQEAAYNVPTLANLDWQNIMNRLNVGQIWEEYGRRQRAEEVQAYQQNQLAPWTRLQGIMSAFSGLPSGSTVKQTADPNLIAMGLGGALTGASLWNQLRGPQQMNPYSAAPTPGYPGGYGPGRGWA